MRVSLIEAPEGMAPETREWKALAEAIRSAGPDVLVTNEMPFGEWLAASDRYDPGAAARSVELHQRGLAALRSLGVPTILSSRPVPAGSRLANEAFVLREGVYKPAHHKQYFPAEKGFYETAWFTHARRGFEASDAGQIRAGFLLCTELYFNEWARHYRREGTQLIAVPRASGSNMHGWHAAASMAAIVSGCYVVSSNRNGKAADGQVFGGRGFAFAPDGSLIAETSLDQPVVTVELDSDWVERRRAEYPCYVQEISPD